ncbi:neurotrypsin-like [Diadema antillarum]|uniref:neurotrypsin-like n=1 Tax=Diadema antillarum TaxID=105358 RepID=UPI003A8496B2
MAIHRNPRKSCIENATRGFYLAMLYMFIVFHGPLSLAAVSEPPASNASYQIPDIKVRLLEGMDAHEGILEFYHRQNQGWVSVCGEAIQLEDADVVCRELGFHGADSLTNVTRSMSGDALLHVWCDTTDGQRHQALDECNLSGLVNSTQCNNKAPKISCLTTRLYGGSDESSGRVQVWSDGQWGKVCSSSFGANEQRVVCAELGYMYRSNRTYSANQFKNPDDNYSIRDVSCSGTEAKIVDCDVTMSTSDSCPDNFVDAIAICTNKMSDPGMPPYLSVKLEGGQCDYEGRVEVYDGSEYGTVCQDYITDMDAQVICRQLGFEAEGAEVVPCCDVFSGARVGVPDLFGMLNCTGDELSIGECPHPTPGSRKGCSTIRHTNDVGIRCQGCHPRKPNVAAIIAGVVAFVVVTIVVAVVIWYVCCIPKSLYQQARNEKEDDDEPDPELAVAETKADDDNDDDAKLENGKHPVAVAVADEDHTMIETDLNDDDLRERNADEETKEMEEGV